MGSKHQSTVPTVGPPKGLFLALLAFRLLNSVAVQTYFNPDEFWQGPEVAHRMVFGCRCRCSAAHAAKAALADLRLYTLTHRLFPSHPSAAAWADLRLYVLTHMLFPSHPSAAAWAATITALADLRLYLPTQRLFPSHPSAAAWAVSGGFEMSHHNATPRGATQGAIAALTELHHYTLTHKLFPRTHPSASACALACNLTCWFLSFCATRTFSIQCSLFPSYTSLPPPPPARLQSHLLVPPLLIHMHLQVMLSVPHMHLQVMLSVPHMHLQVMLSVPHMHLQVMLSVPHMHLQVMLSVPHMHLQVMLSVPHMHLQVMLSVPHMHLQVMLSVPHMHLQVMLSVPHMHLQVMLSVPHMHLQVMLSIPHMHLQVMLSVPHMHLQVMLSVPHMHPSVPLPCSPLHCSPSQLLCNLTCWFLFFCATRTFSNSLEASLALACNLTCWFLLFCATRTFSNSLEASLAVIALSYWPWRHCQGGTEGGQGATEARQGRSGGEQDKGEGGGKAAEQGRGGGCSVTEFVSHSFGGNRPLALAVAAAACMVRPTSTPFWLPLGLHELSLLLLEGALKGGRDSSGGWEWVRLLLLESCVCMVRFAPPARPPGCPTCTPSWLPHLHALLVAPPARPPGCPTCTPFWLPLCGFTTPLFAAGGRGAEQQRGRWEWVQLLGLEVLPVGLTAVAITVAVDSWQYGRPMVFTPLNLLHFNVHLKGSSLYGSNPWHWYWSQGFIAMRGTFFPLTYIHPHSPLRFSSHHSTPFYTLLHAASSPQGLIAMHGTFFPLACIQFSLAPLTQDSHSTLLYPSAPLPPRPPQGLIAMHGTFFPLACLGLLWCSSRPSSPSHTPPRNNHTTVSQHHHLLQRLHEGLVWWSVRLPFLLSLWLPLFYSLSDHKEHR
ncbi:unnamed protein product [Closterium sp. Naga37s-1]|nr:unnamed protein product [Closterium sp. Naga37s-1]